MRERLNLLLSGSTTAQGARFLLSGGFVAVVYVGTTSLLAFIGLPFQVALAIGFAIAIATHFTLQRAFVWTHSARFALGLRGQIARYLLLAGLQYGITAIATATLPRRFGVNTEIVYLITAAVLSCTNFLLFRSRVFHHVKHDEPASANI